MSDKVKDDKLEEEQIEESSAPLLDHLIELRTRLIWCVAYILVAFFICMYFANDVYTFLAQPFVDVAIKNGKEPNMIFTGLQEMFFVNIRLSFYVALAVTFPMVSMQIWKFVAPGLYQNERSAFLPFLAGTPVLFVMGASLADGNIAIALLANAKGPIVRLVLHRGIPPAVKVEDMVGPRQVEANSAGLE